MGSIVQEGSKEKGKECGRGRRKAGSVGRRGGTHTKGMESLRHATCVYG